MNKPLSSGKCEPCNGNTSKLDYQEISKFLSELNEWSVNDNQEMIFKKFKFSNFKKAISFANEVGEVAEKEGHHPYIHINYKQVVIILFTHKINGLHENDFILASKCDIIFKLTANI